MANARDGGASVSVAVSGITASSGTVTYATSSTTGLFAGQTVTVSGATASGYNGTVTIASVTTNTNFTVTSAASGSTSTATAVGYTGNPRIDFAWGNVPLQPDDDRQSSPSQTVTVSGAGNVAWTTYGTLASAKLATSNISTTLNGNTYLTAPDNHVRAAQNWDAYPASPNTGGIPTTSTVTTVPALLGTTLKYAVDKLHDTGFDVGTITYTTTGATLATANAVVTGASATGGVVTYVAANTFTVGALVSITGLSTGAFNLSNVVIASASATGFTVTNAATGTTVTGATAPAVSLASAGTVKSQSLAAAASSTQGTAVDLVLFRYQDGTTPGIVVPGGYVAG